MLLGENSSVCKENQRMFERIKYIYIRLIRQLIGTTLSLILLAMSSYVWSANAESQAHQAMLDEKYAKALEIVLPQAKKNNAWAQLLLSQLYEKGHGVKQDEKQALFWLKKSAAADSTEAKFKLGMYYLNHIKKNNAAESFEKAAQLLNTAASRDAKLRRQIFYSSKAAYIKGNYRQSFIMADAAANHGDSDAQFLIGVMFDKGQGVPVYQSEAINWYRQAAQQGHAMAQLYLAIKFDRGDGVGKNSEKAFKWYQKAAKQNITKAMIRLGELYSNGMGVEKNPEYSLGWLKKAAEKDSPKAMKLLALKYKQGDGVKQSRYNAADWYYRAGKTYFQSGDKEQALAAIESIEELVPNHFLSKRLLNEIYHPPSASNKQAVNANVGNTVYGTAWPITENYVVTAYHVLEGRRKIKLVTTEGTEISAKLAIFDHANDLALLKVKAPLTPLALGEQAIDLGEDVFTIGYPEPDLLGKKAKYTTGKVNSVFGFMDDPRFLQISTPVLSGNSGGPLFNKEGQVVGIIISQLNAMKMFETTGDIPQNVNYAIKLPYLKALLKMAPDNINLSSNIAYTEKGMIRQLARSVLTVIAE